MDIYCPKMGCGEPVDSDYFHDVADEKSSTYTAVSRDFQQRGCVAIGAKHSDNGSDRGVYAEALYDLLGDDLDGAASMMQDFPDLFG